jgi:hypothetical protein
VLSVLYVVVYLGLGVPAVIAGVLVTEVNGLLATAREYGAAVVALAALALVGLLVHRPPKPPTARRRAAAPPPPGGRASRTGSDAAARCATAETNSPARESGQAQPAADGVSGSCGVGCGLGWRLAGTGLVPAALDPRE